MNYREAIQFLYDLQLFGARFGLETTLRLAALAGNPHERLRFIHVAGTNGKGSTCAMLESIYRAAGLRVGLYTSPHLVHFGERIQVNRQPIAERDLVELVADMQSKLHGFTADSPPTFFEVVTVIALEYFARQKCDLVIWETGLGGRLDATNIVTPLASVITNIQFDHQKWLGATLAEIASEKAGIIKPGVPVVTATDDAEAFEVIRATAERLGSPLTRVVEEDARHKAPALGEMSLVGEYQRRNAALALATVEVLRPTFPVTPSRAYWALANVEWSGRFQLIRRGDGAELLLDGAHNPAGAEALRSAVEHYFPAGITALILGILIDKDCHAICRILAPLAPRIFLVPVHSARTALTPDLSASCRAANPVAEIVECAGLGAALDRAGISGLSLVTGSLYLVGEALELLRFGNGGGPGERDLNEWSVKP